MLRSRFLKASVMDFLDLLSKLYKVILTPTSVARTVAYKTSEVTICQRSRAVHLASANRG